MIKARARSPARLSRAIVEVTSEPVARIKIAGVIIAEMIRRKGLTAVEG
jgi:hypothetical protein